MDQLSADGFQQMPSPCAPSAVYCLVRQGEVVYVGKSKSVYHRIASHYAARFITKKRSAQKRIWLSEGEPRNLDIRFDEVWVLFCDQRDLERLELEYIDRFKPQWNIQIREPLPNLKLDIHALAAKMNWELRKDIPRRKGL